MRALSCRYCFFCSSDPVSASIHFLVMSVLSFGGGFGCCGGVELCDAIREEARGRPELGVLLLAPGVEGEHLARGALLARHLLHVDEPLLLDAHEQRV